MAAHRGGSQRAYVRRKSEREACCAAEVTRQRVMLMASRRSSPAAGQILPALALVLPLSRVAALPCLLLFGRCGARRCSALASLPRLCLALLRRGAQHQACPVLCCGACASGRMAATQRPAAHSAPAAPYNPAPLRPCSPPRDPSVRQRCRSPPLSALLLQSTMPSSQHASSSTHPLGAGMCVHLTSPVASP